MMVFTSVYGIVDGFFVSNFVGASAFTAINLMMPVLMIIAALGFMLGAGGSALVAKTLGEGNRERADKIFSMLVYCTASIGVAVSLVVLLFLEPIARGLGGKTVSEETLQNALLYGRIFIAFETAYMLQNLFQSFFVTAERAHLGFYVTLAAGGTNMLLDALFVAVCKWGLAGAAVATGLSQLVGAGIPVVYFGRRNTSLLRLRRANVQWRALGQSILNGSSELLSNISMSVVGILYNRQLLRFAGENGVAAYGVIMYAGFVFFAVFIGFVIGVAPIVGYHFGAKNRQELKSLLRKSLLIIGIFSVGMVVLTETLAEALSGIFVGYDKPLQALTVKGFRIYGVSFALCGFNIFASGFFTALSDGVTSALISFSRTLLFQVAAVLCLPVWWGLDGIWWATAVAELLALAVSVCCFAANRRKYGYI